MAHGSKKKRFDFYGNADHVVLGLWSRADLGGKGPYPQDAKHCEK